MRIWTRKSASIQPRTSSGKSDGVVAQRGGTPARPFRRALRACRAVLQDAGVADGVEQADDPGGDLEAEARLSPGLRRRLEKRRERRPPELRLPGSL